MNLKAVHATHFGICLSQLEAVGNDAHAVAEEEDKDDVDRDLGERDLPLPQRRGLVLADRGGGGVVRGRGRDRPQLYVVLCLRPRWGRAVNKERERER